MDFYFSEKSHSARFVDFLEGVVPTKVSRFVTANADVPFLDLPMPEAYGQSSGGTRWLYG